MSRHLRQRFRAEVALRYLPLVMLLGEHRPDQADNRIGIGEDPHYVRAPLDLLS